MAEENLEEVIKDLRKSLAWLDLVLATLKEGVLTLEKDLKIHFANDAIAAILDVNRIFLLGLPLWDALPLYKNGKVLKKTDYTRALLKNNIQSLTGIYSLLRADKSFIVDVTFGYIPKIKQIAIVVRDVTKLQQETAYVKLHQEIAAAANESETFEEAMSTCLKLVCSHTNWPVGHVYYVNEAEELKPTSIWYFKKPRQFAVFRKITESTILKRGEGLPGRVLAMGKPAWIIDVNKDKNFPRIREAKEVGIKAGIAFPILTREEVVAVIEFFSTVAIQPDESLLRVMAHIGTQLGRVIERIRSEEERLKLTREQAARKEAEITKQKVQLSEIRHRTMIEQSPLSIQILSPDGFTIQVNTAWEKLWGVTLQQIKGYNMLKDKQLEDLGILSYIKKGFRGESTIIPAVKYDPEKTIKNITNVPARWVRAFIYPVKDEKGKIREVVLIHEDITEQRHSEEELRYQKTLLEAQREVAPEGVLVVSPDGKMVSYNNRFIKMWKFSKNLMSKGQDELALRDATQQLTDPQNFIKRVQEIYKSHQVSFEELHFKDGRVFDRYGSPIIGEDGTDYGYVWFFQDVTERKKLERQKDEFISIASHELKTPVTSIKSFGQVLQLRFKKEGNVQASELLGKMDAQVDKLTNLIGDLLDVTKIETGRVQYNNDFFIFDDLVSELVEEMQRTTHKHTLIQKGETKKKICADRERIGQVLTNFLSNAIKYSPHTDKIIIHLSADKGQATVCVQDFGVGIPKEKQDKVFQRFFRVSGPGKETYPGLGLGLYISSEIIRRQGGKIWVESKVGKGSTFCFALPVKVNQNKKKKNGLAEEEIRHD